MKHPVTYDMIEAFVKLAETLNLSKTTDELKATRQTIKRRIDSLEEIIGPLFSLKDRRYSLTKNGENSLEAAKQLLSSRDLFLNSPDRRGLRQTFHDTNGVSFEVQQHKLTDIRRLAPLPIREAFKCWASSDFDDQSNVIKEIKDNIVLCRLTSLGPLYMHIGSKSAEAMWKGDSWRKSSIGLEVLDDQPHLGARDYLKRSFQSVLQSGSCWYDHIVTRAEHPEIEGLQPLNYQRLVMPFKDQFFGIISVRTNDIDLDGFKLSEMQTMPKALITYG
jgi:hypothetical protein